MIDKKIKTCHETIVLIAKTILATFGAGFAATMYFANKLVELFNQTTLLGMIVLELIGIGMLSLLVFIKLVIIQNLNLKDR